MKLDVKSKKPGERERSDDWPEVRNTFLEENPVCAVCGETHKKDLEVHHIKPFHLFPELELDKKNLIVLCEGSKDVNCHLFFGHLGNYKAWNPEVKEDAKKWNRKLKTRPLA